MRAETTRVVPLKDRRFPAASCGELRSPVSPSGPGRPPGRLGENHDFRGPDGRASEAGYPGRSVQEGSGLHRCRLAFPGGCRPLLQPGYLSDRTGGRGPFFLIACAEGFAVADRRQSGAVRRNEPVRRAQHRRTGKTPPFPCHPGRRLRQSHPDGGGHGLGVSDTSTRRWISGAWSSTGSVQAVTPPL